MNDNQDKSLLVADKELDEQYGYLAINGTIKNCSKKQFARLIGSYKATMAFRDQKLLMLLIAHENQGFSFRNLSPRFLIGKQFRKATGVGSANKSSKSDDAESDSSDIDASALDNEEHKPAQSDAKGDESENHDDQKNPGIKVSDSKLGDQQKASKLASGVKAQATPASDFVQFLQQFSQDRLQKTIFSVPRDLQLASVYERQTDSTLYDVRFFLAAFYHLLSDDQFAFEEFIQHNCLSLVFNCLSLSDESIRRAAYLLLDLFRRRCIGNYGRLWQLLLDCLRSSLSEPNQQLLAIQCSFLIHLIPFIQNPNYSIYQNLAHLLSGNLFQRKHMMNFLRQMLQTEDEEQGSLYQNVALIILRRGLQTKSDFQLCNSHNLIYFLFSSYNSPLFNVKLKKNILDIFISIAKIPQAVQQLCTESAFLLWLNQILLSHAADLNVLERVNQILIAIEDGQQNCQSMNSKLNIDDKQQQQHQTGMQQHPCLLVELKLIRNTCIRLIDQVLDNC